jgi:hypothetical protein
MANKWNYIPQTLPPDAQKCYIRLNANAYNYFEATYNIVLQGFTDDINGIFYPTNFVWKWKAKT